MHECQRRCDSCQEIFRGDQVPLKFIFETVSVKKESDRWVVICLVQDLFEEDTKMFKLIVDDSGDIQDVERIDQIPR